MVVTLTGANDFLRHAELEGLAAGFVREHDEMAIERFDGEEDDSVQMRGAINSLPFLTTRKLVVLREPGRQKVFAENINDILKEVADSTDLIIVEPKLDKRLTYYKTLKKETDFREFGDLDGAGLATWAAAYAKQKGGSLKPEDARLLVDRLGPNQQLIKSELDKLLGYDEAITKETIEMLVEPLPQSTIFELLDAAFQGKTERALHLYQEQRALKVEPQAIIALLAWQLHVLALVKTAASRSPDQIAKDGKLNPFVVRKSLGLARGLSLSELRDHIDRLLDLDTKLKKVSIDADEALQLYLLQLANR